MNNIFLPEWLIIWIWKSLLGEIYPSIRAIAVKFTEKRDLTIRYYIDREATEDDYESISCVVTNILSNTSSNEDIKTVNEEIIYSRDILGELDVLDGLVYARREY